MSVLPSLFSPTDSIPSPARGGCSRIFPAMYNPVKRLGGYEVGEKKSVLFSDKRVNRGRRVVWRSHMRESRLFYGSLQYKLGAVEPWGQWSNRKEQTGCMHSSD